MKVTEKNLAKYSMMRDAGFTKDEIRREFGDTRRKSAKSNDKGDKVMSTYKENKASINPTVFWNMVDEGKTAKEIADYFGCSVQTVYNRITKGRPKIKTAKDCENERASEDATVSKTETVPETNENVTETSENVTEISVDVSEAARTVEDVCSDKYEGITSASESVEEPSPVRTEDAAQVHIDEEEGVCSSDQSKPDLLMLAIRAASMASSAGFVPDHMVLDSQAARDFMRVSGVGASGKVYEIELSVTDPAGFRN